MNVVLICVSTQMMITFKGNPKTIQDLMQAIAAILCGASHLFGFAVVVKMGLNRYQMVFLGDSQCFHP